jgi:TolA-binding protein
MMIQKLIRFSALFISVIAFTACQHPQDDMRKQISAAEKTLFKDSLSMQPDVTKADSIIHMYTEYALKFQDDTLTPEYLFRAGDIANGIGKFKESIEYFGRVGRYPNYAKLPSAVFLQGFISENSLKDTAQARRFYETFLKQYPTHKLAGDVRISLANMGKTPEQLIQEFEQKNQSDSLSAK